MALAITNLKDSSEALQFLKDFLTEYEFETLTKRLSVIYWLTKKRSYENIQTNLKVSSATIAEAKNLIDKKSIKEITKRLDADEWADKWSKKIRALYKKEA